MPAVAAALNGAFKWQASVICSRPGAPAGRWHTDGGHSKHDFDGRSGAPYALCAFVPLVPLEAPSRLSACGAGALESGVEAVEHGRGCTAFWPGSHRHPECMHLGAMAAKHMHVVVPGAPMAAGDALVYDYRVVHCASPNCAEALEALQPGAGERPILQLTYCLASYRDTYRNYGFYELWPD